MGALCHNPNAEVQEGYPHGDLKRSGCPHQITVSR